MAESQNAAEPGAKGKRDRSPAFPFIPLKTAIERLVSFEEYFKRHPAPMNKAGLAWQMGGGSSQALQTMAALKAFGLLELQRDAGASHLTVSEDGRTYLRAQQDTIKRDVLRRAALKPKQIESHWRQWGADRPPDPVALDALILKEHFTQDGAEKFLKVYDATIAYAGLSDSDKIPAENDGNGKAASKGSNDDPPPPPPPPPPPKRETKLMLGERELTTGILSKDGAAFRLIVTGQVGVKEIERLIKKLEFDKDILAGDDEADPE